MKKWETATGYPKKWNVNYNKIPSSSSSSNNTNHTSLPVTTAKKVMFNAAFVCLRVHNFTYSQLHITTDQLFMEISTTDVQMRKNWTRFLKDSLTLRDRAIPPYCSSYLWKKFSGYFLVKMYIFCENFMNITSKNFTKDVHFDKNLVGIPLSKSPLNFASKSRRRLWIPGVQIWTRYAFSYYKYLHCLWLWTCTADPPIFPRVVTMQLTLPSGPASPAQTLLPASTITQITTSVSFC